MRIVPMMSVNDRLDAAKKEIQEVLDSYGVLIHVGISKELMLQCIEDESDTVFEFPTGTYVIS